MLQEKTLERTRLQTVVFTIALSIIAILSVADHPWSNGRTAIALNGMNLAVFLWHIIRFRDAAMARLLLFGVCFGIVELIADALCVRFTRTLDYSVAHSTLLGLSPWWMPSAWAIVAAQIGYIGLRLIAWQGLGCGILLTALLGAINIPFYEEMAYHAHWWRYQNCHRIGHTPLYIIAAELLIGLTLGPLAGIAMRHTPLKYAVLAGLIGGLGTIVSGIIGYGLMDKIL